MNFPEGVVCLSDFTAIIQLWAGICLLFFYEGLLEDSPLKRNRKETVDLYNNFVLKYQDYIKDKKIDIERYLNINWEDYMSTIKNMAALSFFYSILVLIYIGIENDPLYTERYVCLQITNVAIFVYMLFSIIGIHLKMFHTYYTPIIYIVIILAYFFFFPTINNWLLERGLCIAEPLSRTKTTITTIVTCIVGLFFILIHMGIDSYVLNKQKDIITKISINFEALVGIIMRTRGTNDLPESLKELLKKKIANDVIENGKYTTEMLDKIVKDEINNELDILNTPLRIRTLKKIIKFLKHFSPHIYSIILRVFKIDLDMDDHAL